MDESAYRQVLAASTQLHCPFEKSILSACAACAMAERRNIAEREIVDCSNADALDRCMALRDYFRHSFAFALHKAHIDGPLPHAQEMRVQCGGLIGLQISMDGNDQVHDVSGLVVMAQQKFGELEDFPYSQIIQLAHTHYQAR